MPKKKINIVLIFCLSLSVVINIAFVNRYGIMKKIKNRIAPPLQMYSFESSAWKGFVDFYRKMSINKCDILFCGDSMIERADWHVLFPEYSVVQMGIGGDTVEGLLNRLDEVISCKPKFIFIEIGVNDLLNYHRINYEIFDEIINRCQEELPETKIFVQSLYPVTKKFSLGSDFYVDKSEILKANETIRKLCQNKNIVYVDMYSFLENGSGYLEEKESPDGLHIMGGKYFDIAKELRNKLYEN